MSEAIQVIASAGTNVLEYGVVGAMLIISLAANAGQWWFARKDRKRYTDHLENHYHEVGK